MNSIKYGDEILEYTLIRKKKKHLSITIKPDATLVVSAPIGASLKDIENRLYKKLKWIWSKLDKVRADIIVLRQKEYISGESFLYLGKNYKLKVINDDSTKSMNLKLHRGALEIKVPKGKEIIEKDIKSIIEKWYKEQATKKIEERVKLYIQKTSLQPSIIRVKELKSSWGLCTSRRNITLNWRIIMAPLSVLDYVVIHEMCHLRHHNHGKEFWGLVGVYMPDYKARKEWLRVNGRRLVV